MKKRKGKQVLVSLLCAAVLLVQPGTVYGVETRQSSETAHVHGPECYQLICDYTEDDSGTDKKEPAKSTQQKVSSQESGGDKRSTPSTAEPDDTGEGGTENGGTGTDGTEDNDSGNAGSDGGGHKHTKSCYKLECQFEKEQEEPQEENVIQPQPENIIQPQLTDLLEAVTQAQTPRFKKNLHDIVVYQGETSFTLEVEAITDDGGEITYDWYQGYSRNDPAPIIIHEAGNDSTCTLDVDDSQPAREYYHVTATNLIKDDDGMVLSEATTKSKVIKVTKSDQPRPSELKPEKPVFTTNLQDITVAQGAADFTLLAEARTNDGGAITYDWYQGTDGADPNSFTLMEEGNTTGVRRAEVATLLSEGSYFYVTAVNTLTNKQGNKFTAESKSKVIKVTQSDQPQPIVPVPEKPVFTTNLQDITVAQGTAGFTLRVKAETDDGGAITYDWYQGADAADPDSFTLIESGDIYGAYQTTAEAIFSGKNFFYAIAVNTLRDSEGTAYKAEERSNIAEVTVSSEEEPMSPVLDESGIVDAAYTIGQAAAALSVKATVTDGGSLSYQWYQRSLWGQQGVPIDGATGTSFTPPTSSMGIAHYYVVVTNHLGGLEKEMVSKTAQITVFGGSIWNPGSGSSKVTRAYNTPYEAKKAVEEMLANRSTELSVTASSAARGWLVVQTDFDMTALSKKAEAIPESEDRKILSVVLPTEGLTGQITENIVGVEYQLPFSNSIWKSGERELELLLDKEFLRSVGGTGRDVRILCQDQNGKPLYRLTLSSNAIMRMKETGTGLYHPGDSSGKIEIRMKYEDGVTTLKGMEGYSEGLISIETPG